jgi:hypothetical protein
MKRCLPAMSGGRYGAVAGGLISVFAVALVLAARSPALEPVGLAALSAPFTSEGFWPSEQTGHSSLRWTDGKGTIKLFGYETAQALAVALRIVGAPELSKHTTQLGLHTSQQHLIQVALPPNWRTYHLLVTPKASRWETPQLQLVSATTRAGAEDGRNIGVAVRGPIQVTILYRWLPVPVLERSLFFATTVYLVAVWLRRAVATRWLYKALLGLSIVLLGVGAAIAGPTTTAYHVPVQWAIVIAAAGLATLRWWILFHPATVVGIVLRCLWIITDPHVIAWDEIEYHRLAVRLASGKPYGMQIWPPGWPITLNVYYRLFGPTIHAGPWLNFCGSVATILLVGLVTDRLFGRKASALSLWIISLMPSYILSNVLLMYEVWLQLLIVLALWLALRGTWTPGISISIACITALASLMRPFWIVLPLLLWLCTRLYRRQGPRMAQLALAQAVAALLITPWILYVSTLAGRFVPIALNGGVNLWIGNNPKATGGLIDPPGYLWDPRNEARARDEAIAYMIAQPWHAVALIPKKLSNLLTYEYFGDIVTSEQLPPEQVSQVRHLMNISYWIILAPALSSIALLIIRRQIRLLTPLILFGYNIASYLPFFGDSRYRWPLQFIVIIYAAALPTIWAGWQASAFAPRLTVRNKTLHHP